MTDPIADFLIRIKNALAARHEVVRVPYSKVKHSIADILVQEGYVTSVSTEENGFRKDMVVTLKYKGKLPLVNNVKRLSKPGRRLYTSTTQIPKTLGGYGITIVSTNQGLLTDKEARKKNVGGELVCQIW